MSKSWTSLSQIICLFVLLPILGHCFTISPSSASLYATQGQAFSCSGLGCSGVTWSISGAGSIDSSGNYTAPSSISSGSTVTVTATGPGGHMTANATITLNVINVSVSCSPGYAYAASTASCSASASYGSVTWSVAGGGSISAGTYTAPSSISAPGTATVTATSAVDTSQSGNASISLVTVPLPIEIFGGSSTASVSTTVYLPSAGTGTVSLQMQIHGVHAQTLASVAVNSMTPEAINNTNCPVQGNAANYGGIGGAFSTLTCIMTLPSGTVAVGPNTITFYFNGTDGRAAGFRVLSFQLVDATPTNLIPSAEFYWTDPSTWTYNPSDVSPGQTLWNSASLTEPISGVTTSITATCGTCHAKDGRDLKYFNYSPTSIIYRSQFHGLTSAQGAQIAAYILSLSVPNPGRPWNPPYQPGAGIDAGGATNWAAGAGLSAVLANDGAMAAYLIPGGSYAGWTAGSYLNSRQMPMSLQQPDWNSWLPLIAPQDSWPNSSNPYGAAFTSSTAYTYYTSLSSTLTSANYSTKISTFGYWYQGMFQTFIIPIWTYWYTGSNCGGGDPTYHQCWTSLARQQVYSAGQWFMVKQWELMQENSLEGQCSVPFPSTTEPMCWPIPNSAFMTSPNMMHITPGTGLGDGSVLAQTYLAYIWYQVQLVLNDGNGLQHAGSPEDYPYVFQYSKNLNWDGSPAYQTDEFYFELYWSLKGMQTVTAYAHDPSYGISGWAWSYGNPELLVDPSWIGGGTTPAGMAYGMSTADVEALVENFLTSWYNQASSYTVAEYCSGGWVGTCSGGVSTQDPSSIGTSYMGGAIWWMLPRMRVLLGVPSTLTNAVSAWAATIWPVGNWSANNSATCTNFAHCSTD